MGLDSAQKKTNKTSPWLSATCINYETVLIHWKILAENRKYRWNKEKLIFQSFPGKYFIWFWCWQDWAHS